MIKSRAFTVSTVIVCLALSSCTYGTSKYVDDSQGVDQLKILQLARNGNFQELESLLETYQRNYEQDVDQEIQLHYAFGVFQNSDPALEPILNQWVADRPSSYIAKLARGNYVLYQGILARGFKYAQGTSEQHFRSMEDFFRLAEKDFADAIQVYPRNLAGYMGLLVIDRVSGVSESVQPLLSARLKIHPGSLVLRAKTLYYQQPKWGGTPESLEAALAEVQRSSRTYKNLTALLGYKDYIAGMQAFDAKQYARAQEFYLKALSVGTIVDYQMSLAAAYDVDDKPEQALSVVEDVLSRWPNMRGALLQKVIILRTTGRCSEAQEAIKMYQAIDPADVYMLRNQASCAFRLGVGSWGIPGSDQTK